MYWSIESLGGRQLQSDRGRLRVIGYLSHQLIAESMDYLTFSSSECLEDTAKAEFRMSATGRPAAQSMEVWDDGDADEILKYR